MSINKDIIYCIIIVFLIMSLPEEKYKEYSVTIKCQNASAVVPLKSASSANEIIAYLSEALSYLENDLDFDPDYENSSDEEEVKRHSQSE